MRVLFSFVFLVLLLACGTSTPPVAKKPNIIFIMADDLGYGDLGSYGQQLIKTPNLDQMAAEGMRFTQFYAGTSVCAPSRSVLMTGLHTGHTPIRGNFQFGSRNGQLPLADSLFILPEVLKSAGYRTAMIGKWGLGDPNTEGAPSRQGFDHFFGYTDQVLAHNYYPEYLWRNDEKVYLSNEVLYLDSTAWHEGLGSYATEKVEYSHDLFEVEAKTFITSPSEQPFFLYLPLTIPHDNGEAPENLRQEVPDQGIYASMEWEREAKDYAAMVTRMDASVGALLALLRERELASETVVFFTSDNGSMPDRSYTEFLNSNGPLRGGKRDLYEGGIRVPFIAWWPEVITAGTTSDHIGAFWDILPTFSDLAQVRSIVDTDGLSFVPTLLGAEGRAQHDWLYWEFHEQGGKQAVRQGPWKAVRLEAKANPNAPLELYNLQQDLGERQNIADQHPEKVEELSKLMSGSRTYSSHFPFGIQ